MASLNRIAKIRIQSRLVKIGRRVLSQAIKLEVRVSIRFIGNSGLHVPMTSNINFNKRAEIVHQRFLPEHNNLELGGKQVVFAIDFPRMAKGQEDTGSVKVWVDLHLLVSGHNRLCTYRIEL